MMDEIWKPIPDTDYAVSNTGKVASMKNGWLVLKPFKAGAGYFVVGIPKKQYVHRLVAQAFLGDPPSRQHQVNHRDGDKSNNIAGNLEWVTHRDNMNHSIRILGNTRGERHGNAKLTDDGVVRIRELLLGGHTQQSVAVMSGVSRGTISDIATRGAWAHVQ
jgi:hypothetical protein